MSVSKEGVTLVGAVAAALGASACCLGPLLLTALGLGGAASAVALAAYRPYFLLLAAVLLAGAFYLAYRRPATACAPGASCDRSGAVRAGRVLLWVAAALVLLAATFPYYSIYLL
jgi:mercuric ion transport protein